MVFQNTDSGEQAGQDLRGRWRGDTSHGFDDGGTTGANGCGADGRAIGEPCMSGKSCKSSSSAEAATSGAHADSLCWTPPTTMPTLAASDVHVWKISLNREPPEVHTLTGSLSDDERERAGRFFFERDRRRFIVCRGLLRTLLGSYLGVAPRSLEFRYSAYGKPGLMSEAGALSVRFNVSHADETAICGFTIGRDIGVDIEHVRAEFATNGIAERFFSSREVAVLRTLTDALYVEAFFRCWTRKEAYVKARGEGISLPLGDFNVSLLPGEPAALLSARGDLHEAARWSLRELQADAEYVAAIAVEGHDWQLRCWRWPDV